MSATLGASPGAARYPLIEHVQHHHLTVTVIPVECHCDGGSVLDKWNGLVLYQNRINRQDAHQVEAYG